MFRDCPIHNRLDIVHVYCHLYSVISALEYIYSVYSAL
jgi:hypothetical protein